MIILQVLESHQRHKQGFLEIEDVNMTNASKSRITHTIRHIVQLLVECNYAKLEKESSRVRLTKCEIMEAVENYGSKIGYAPESAYEQLDVISNMYKEGVFSVRFHLYDINEAELDLEVQLTIYDNIFLNVYDGVLRYEIDNILVA